MKLYKKTHVRQHDQSDCGVACLLSVMQLHGGSISLESLREWSGTNKQGTTLLGLYQCAEKLGYEAKAFKATPENLKEVKNPCILHVLVEDKLQHYIVFYEFKDGFFICGDPAKGIVKYTAEELSKIWKSQALLRLQPTEKLSQNQFVKNKQLAWLKSVIKEDSSLLTIAAFLGIIVAALGLSTALFSQKLIDEILPAKDITKLSLGLVALGLVLFIRNIISYFRSIVLIKQVLQFNKRLIDRFYGLLIDLPKSFFDFRKTGELVARMNDTQRIQGTISYLVGSVVIEVLVLLVTLIFIFMYDWRIASFTVVSIPAYFLLAWLYINKILEKQRNFMGSYAKNESNYIDTIQGIGEIKIFNKQSIFRSATSFIYGDYQQKAYDLGFLNTKFNLIAGLISYAFTMTIMVWGAFLVFNDSLLLGELMAILSVSGSTVGSAYSLSTANIKLQEARVAFERMYEFVSLQPENENGQSEKIDDIDSLKIEDIQFRFLGRKPILKEVSFTLRKGEIAALVGESGSGKSTLIQLLQKFYPPEAGEIVVDHKKWNEISTKNWRDLIAVVPQQVKLFNGSLIENICFEKAATEVNEFIAFCQQYGFHPYFEKFPQGYATMLGEEGTNISGGQMQLVALARALYKKPKLLILDEATAALDVKTESFVLNLLQNLKSQMGILMVTHRMQSTAIADRVYQIEEGVLKEYSEELSLLS